MCRRRRYEDINDDDRRGPCACLPTRHVFSMLVFSGLTIFCIMRVNMNVAIVAMVKPEVTISKAQTQVVECAELLPEPWNKTDDAIQIISNSNNKIFDWSIETQSIILGAFAFGYTFGQLPGIILAEHCGGKWTFGIGLLLSSVITLLTPWAAEKGSMTLAAVRAMQGLAQCTAFPAMNILISQWIPTKERNLTLSFIHNGLWFGFALGVLLSGFFASSELLGGWPAVFYVFGISGCLFFLLWALLIYESPSKHPRISTTELNLIRADLVDFDEKSPDVPWKAMFKSVPTWALVIAIFGYRWECYVISVEMPTFLANIMHFGIFTNGLLCSVPYVLQSVGGIGAALITGRMINDQKASVSFVRKLMNTIASFGSGICILLVIFAGCNPIHALALIYVAMLINGCAMPASHSTAVELSLLHTGTLTGVLNMFSCTAGFLVPFVVGELTSNGQTTENWNMVFVITAAVSLFCGTVFDIFGSEDMQDDASEVTPIASAPPMASYETTNRTPR